MQKRVVVIASGLTEFASLPHLMREFPEADYEFHVRIPPRNQPLVPNRVADLVRAFWWDLSGRGQRPDKFVILIDADGHPIEERLKPFIEACSGLTEIGVPRLVTPAQWHLEAWFFAHAEALRGYLGRDLGSVDTSAPDSIRNPKLHLKHLLGVYTYRRAGEIASLLSPSVIRTRSRSFSEFENAVRNGQPAPSPAVLT
jgi:hypothetical protein